MQTQMQQLLLLLLVSGASSSSAVSIKVGQVTPDETCRPHRQGAMLAANLINALNGGNGFAIGYSKQHYVKLDLDSRQVSATDPDYAASHAAEINSLLSAGVDLFVGTCSFSSDVEKPVVDSAAKILIAQVGPNAFYEKQVGAGTEPYNTIFGIHLSSYRYTEPALRLLSMRGAQTLAVAGRQQSLFFKSTCDQAVSLGASYGLALSSPRIEYDESLGTDTAYQQQIARDIAQGNPDAVVGCVRFDEAAVWLKTWKEMQWAPQAVWLTCTTWGLEGFAQQLSSAGLRLDDFGYLLGAGQWHSEMTYTDNLVQTTAAFSSQYAAQFGEDPTYDAVASYSIMYVFMHAIQLAFRGEDFPGGVGGLLCSATSYERLRRELELLVLPQSLYGPIQFDEWHRNVGRMPSGSQLLDPTGAEEGFKDSCIAPSEVATAEIVYPSPSSVECRALDGQERNETKAVCFLCDHCQPCADVDGCTFSVPSELVIGGLFDRATPRRFAAMLAIEVVNNMTAILPRTQLRFDVRDASRATAVRLTQQLLSGQGAEGRLEHPDADPFDAARQVPVVALIGPRRSSEAIPVSQVAAAFEVPVISHSATSDALSDKQLHPYFMRTAPPDTQQALGLSLLVQYYRWRALAIIHVGDAYGTGLAANFQARLQPLGIGVLIDEEFGVGLEGDELESEAKRVVESVHARVKERNGDTAGVVVVVTPPAETSAVLRVAREVGMISEGYAWVGTDSSMLAVDAGRVGMVGLQPQGGEGQAYDQFMDRWKHRYPPGSEGHAAYEQAVGGSIYASYAYDAVIVVANALHSMLEVQQVKPTKGQALYNTMKSYDSNFPGNVDTQQQLAPLTGRISFDSMGDRFSNFVLVNWQSQPGGSTLVRVGDIDVADGVVTTGGEYADVLWPGGVTSAPQFLDIDESDKVPWIAVYVGVPVLVVLLALFVHWKQLKDRQDKGEMTMKGKYLSVKEITPQVLKRNVSRAGTNRRFSLSKSVRSSSKDVTGAGKKLSKLHAGSSVRFNTKVKVTPVGGGESEGGEGDSESDEALKGAGRLAESNAPFKRLVGSEPPALQSTVEHFDLFLSHSWEFGQDQANNINLLSKSAIPDLKVFLDVEVRFNIKDLEKIVQQSTHVLVVLTSKYFNSRNCMRELKAALDAKKHIIVVRETDRNHGGRSLAEHKEQLNEHVAWVEESIQRLTLQLDKAKADEANESKITGLQDQISAKQKDLEMLDIDLDKFFRGVDVIDWQRNRDYKHFALKKIVAMMLHHVEDPQSYVERIAGCVKTWALPEAEAEAEPEARVELEPGAEPRVEDAQTKAAKKLQRWWRKVVEKNIDAPGKYAYFGLLGGLCMKDETKASMIKLPKVPVHVEQIAAQKVATEKQKEGEKWKEKKLGRLEKTHHLLLIDGLIPPLAKVDGGLPSWGVDSTRETQTIPNCKPAGGQRNEATTRTSQGAYELKAKFEEQFGGRLQCRIFPDDEEEDKEAEAMRAADEADSADDDDRLMMKFEVGSLVRVMMEQPKKPTPRPRLTRKQSSTRMLDRAAGFVRQVSTAPEGQEDECTWREGEITHVVSDSDGETCKYDVAFTDQQEGNKPTHEPHVEADRLLPGRFMAALESSAAVLVYMRDEDYRLSQAAGGAASNSASKGQGDALTFRQLLEQVQTSAGFTLTEHVMEVETEGGDAAAEAGVKAEAKAEAKTGPKDDANPLLAAPKKLPPLAGSSPAPGAAAGHAPPSQLPHPSLMDVITQLEKSTSRSISMQVSAEAELKADEAVAKMLVGRKQPAGRDMKTRSTLRIPSVQWQIRYAMGMCHRSERIDSDGWECLPADPSCRVILCRETDERYGGVEFASHLDTSPEDFRRPPERLAYGGLFFDMALEWHSGSIGHEGVSMQQIAQRIVDVIAEGLPQSSVGKSAKMIERQLNSGTHWLKRKALGDGGGGANGSSGGKRGRRVEPGAKAPGRRTAPGFGTPSGFAKEPGAE